MYWIMTTIVYAEPQASLFVDVHGSYFLNVDLQQEWKQAELSFDHSLGLFSKKDIQKFSHEGKFEEIPRVLNMKASLSKGQLGEYASLPIPVIYLPLSQPSLSGDDELGLPAYTFKWNLYKRIYRPVQRWFTHE